MSAVPDLDDQTAVAIRSAIAAAQSGRIPEAVGIGEKALANGGDRASLNAMLGSIHCQTGNLDAGIRHLSVAQAARPDDPVIAGNLATALGQAGKSAQALSILTADLAAKDPSKRLQRLRAFLSQELGEVGVATEAYEDVLASAPDDWQSWNNLGNVRRLAGDSDGAIAALQRAHELNPPSRPIRFNLATSLAAGGRVDDAITHLRAMAVDDRSDATPPRELYAIFKELRREDEALEAIETAAQRSPNDVDLLLTLASQRLTLLRTDAAEQAYEKVIAIDPANELGNLGLAVAYELSNRAEELASLGDAAQKRGASQNAVNFIRAMDHRRAKRFVEGIAALATVPEHLESGRRYHLLGQLQEGAGNFHEAFAAFERMNGLQRDDPSRPEARAQASRDGLRLQRQIVTPEWVAGWRDRENGQTLRYPVFLVGFPRSGTTLLDTMLMGHPDVEVLEEEPTLLEAAKVLQPFEDLPSVSEDQIAKARDTYFSVAKRHVSLDPAKLLIDKNPLSMNMLPIIHRLFPGARIILALRHPCDVVFSSFASNFKLNDAMVNFLDLRTTAEFYDLSFGYFEHVQSLLNLPMHRTVYENVIQNREEELRALIAFLGLDWRDEVLDHEGTARSRGRIKTASYAQVGQPIYTQAAGRWTNFRKQMEPVLPLLEPWLTRFGYKI